MELYFLENYILCALDFQLPEGLGQTVIWRCFQIKC